MSKGTIGDDTPTTLIQDNRFTMKMDYDGSGNLVYLGKAPMGKGTDEPFWQIRRFAYGVSSNLTSVQWANGKPTFESIWDSRAALLYS